MSICFGQGGFLGQGFLGQGFFPKPFFQGFSKNI